MNTIKLLVVSSLLFFIACKTANTKIPNTKTQENINFEGKIIYDVKIEDKTGQMTKEQVKMFMGDEQVYLIKGNKYKSEMNGMLKMIQTYLGKDTLYNQMEGIAGLLWIDASTNPDKLIDYAIQKDAETIAGIRCDLLTINSEEGVTKYYFNKKYYVNPSSFSNHEYGFWKFCIEKTSSLPLKSISNTKDMYYEITAKEIQKIEIDESMFELPNLPRIESPEK